MMRWIVGTSLKFRYLVVAAGVAMMVVRRGAAAEHAGGCLPRVRAAARRGADALPRSHGARGGGARQHAARAVAQRHRGSRRHPLQVGPAALVDRAPLQARHGPAPRSPARAGARRGGDPGAADVGSAAVHHAGDLDDGPCRQDRRLLADAPDRQALDDRVLEDQGAPPARARRRERRHLGRAPGAVPRPGRSEAHARARGHARADDGGHLDRARRRSPALRRRQPDRHRRLHRHAEPAAGRPARPADRDAERPRSGCDRRGGGQDGSPGRRGDGRRRHACRSPATQSSTAVPACC